MSRKAVFLLMNFAAGGRRCLLVRVGAFLISEPFFVVKGLSEAALDAGRRFRCFAPRYANQFYRLLFFAFGFFWKIILFAFLEWGHYFLRFPSG